MSLGPTEAACRIGEVLGVEDSAHCFDVDHRELHVVQQLQYDTAAYGGFYLKEPKGGSAGTVELDDVVAQVLGEHLRAHPPTKVDLVDVTDGDPIRRSARSAPCSPASWPSRYPLMSSPTSTGGAAGCGNGAGRGGGRS